MRKNSWIFVGMVSCFVSCLPPGHPPTEKTDSTQDALVDSDAEAGTELNSVPADADAMKSDEDMLFDSNEINVSDGEIDTPQTDAESVVQADIDAEVDEQKKDTSSDDGAPAISDDDAISSDETPIIPGKDTGADDGTQIDTIQIDTVECPEGSYYDPAKGECVSFCGADKYFEKKIGKCLLYPCSGCDLNGQWELAVLDAESMTFTYYTLTMIQSVSYLKAQLAITSPPEVADCAGTLENKDYTLSCNADEFTLVLTSETAASDEISGFYSYSYKDGKFKNGPCNLKKNN